MPSDAESEIKMLQRICRELQAPNLIEILEKTPMRLLQPILMHAWKKRVTNKKTTDLLAEYESKLEFYGVSSIPQKQLIDFVQICHDSIPANFDIVQTSPITPVGLNSLLSKISQNNTLPTIRKSEVVSDITTQLALECAYRRKKSHSGETVNLCSSGRVLRLQPFDKNKGYMQHFNLFALCSGGTNSVKKGGFAVPWIQSHISILLDILKSLQNKGYTFKNISVNISDMKFLEQLIYALNIPRKEILLHSLDDDFSFFQKYEVTFPSEISDTSMLSSHNFEQCGLSDKTKYFARLEKGIILPLQLKYPRVRFCFDFTRKSGLGYYPHLCFHIFATDQTNRIVQLADGGAVDWLEKLLRSEKGTMVTSGIGSELIQKLFSPKNKLD
ncbi:MAG: hypothetical protein V1732_02805 [Patescibacteria group bacterium]